MTAWTERNWDHERDLRKHEPRPDDPPRKAQDIAVLVKKVDLITGATLIEHYARSIAARSNP